MDSLWHRTVKNYDCVHFILGILNLSHTNSHRVDLWRIELDAVARHFERRMKGCLEFEQIRYIRRQTSDAVLVLLSRIDHSSVGIPSSDIDGMSMMARTIGDIFGTRSPSNHIPS